MPYPNITDNPKQSPSSHTPAILQKVCTFLLAAFMLAWLPTSPAAQSSTQLQVMITLHNNQGASGSGLCRSSARIGTFGRSVVIVCATGQAVEYSGNVSDLPWSSAWDSSLRYVELPPPSTEKLGEINYAGLGTIASWRIVNLAHKDYLELMIRW